MLDCAGACASSAALPPSSAAACAAPADSSTHGSSSKVAARRNCTDVPAFNQIAWQMDRVASVMALPYDCWISSSDKPAHVPKLPFTGLRICSAPRRCYTPSLCMYTTCCTAAAPAGSMNYWLQDFHSASIRRPFTLMIVLQHCTEPSSSLKGANEPMYVPLCKSVMVQARGRP